MPVPLDAPNCPEASLVTAAKRAWDLALTLGEQHGYRNAQATVIAPTGTIGLVMDCDTTGIEPDFALVKFKKLAGGGYFKIINRMVPLALQTLGYSQAEIEEIIRYAVGHGTLGELAGRQPRRAPGQGLHGGGAPVARGRACRRLRHPLRLQPLHPGRGVRHQGAGLHPGPARRRLLRHAGGAGLQQGGCRGGQYLLLRRHDPGGRALSEGEAYLRSSTAPIPAGASASASSRWRAISA